MQVFDVTRGDSPIVLGQPHGGTFVPEDIARRFNTKWRRPCGHRLAHHAAL